jgi:MFS family permease
MLNREFSKKIGITPKSIIANIMLISNVFIWYSLAFSILKKLVTETFLAAWSIHFISATFSAIGGAVICEKIYKKSLFLISWIILGAASSLILMLIKPTDVLDVLLISSLFGVSFGLGLPASMEFFSSCTNIENRAKLAGLIIIVNGLGAFLLLIAATDNTVLQALTLSVWRGSGLIFFIIVKPSQEIAKKSKGISLISVLTQRPFIMYFIPWCMFSLVNFLSLPLQSNILGSNLVSLLNSIEGALVGAFAVIGGFLSDAIGRKRVTIFGFIMLGLGYAILGIYPENSLSWYFYTLVDGVAWGVFSVIFIFTVWGDLSRDLSSYKHYALGGLPFFLSNFIRLTIGSYISNLISAYAIFSFTAFFLFLAVVPLMYAPETLPEKVMRERELRSYVEKAKKIKEKFT